MPLNCIKKLESITELIFKWDLGRINWALMMSPRYYSDMVFIFVQQMDYQTTNLGIIEGIVLGPTLPKIFTAAFVKNKPQQQYYIGVVGLGTFCAAGLRVCRKNILAFSGNFRNVPESFDNVSLT